MVKSALELAKLIATKSPVAVSSSKHLLTHSRDHRFLKSFPLSFSTRLLKITHFFSFSLSSSVPENLAYTSTWNAAALKTNVSFVCFVSVFSHFLLQQQIINYKRFWDLRSFF